MGTANERLNFQVGGLQTLSQAGNVLTGINQTLELIGRTFDLAATAAKSFIATGSQFEQYNVQFETLLHSAELAEKRVGELVKFAAATPFEIPGIIETAKVLQAYEIYSERALTAVGDMAAGMSMEMKEVGLALGAAATGEMERLKMLGITTATVTAHLGHEIVRGTTEGLQELTQAVMELFEIRAAGGMERASKTLVGIFSMLADKWISFKKMVSDTGVFDDVLGIFRGLLVVVESLFESGQAQRFANVIGDTLSTAFEQILMMLGGILDEMAVLVGALRQALGHVDVSGRHPIDQAAWAAVLALSGQYGLAQKTMGGALGMLPDDPGRPDPSRGLGARYAAWSMFHRRSGAGRSYGAPTPPAYGEMPWSAPAAGPGWGTTDWESFGRAPGIRHAGGVRGGDGADAGFYGGAAGTEAQEELDEQERERWAQRAETQQRYLAILQGNWLNYYNAISRASQAWAHGEGKVFKDLYKASRSFLAATLSDFIQTLTQKAVLGRMMAAAEALTAEGRYDFWAAAKHIGAAAAYGVIGGVSSGMVEGFIGGENPYAAGMDIAGDTPGGVEEAPGTRTLSKQVGIKTQSLTFNTYLVLHGPNYFGRDGMRQMVDEEVIPALEDWVEMRA